MPVAARKQGLLLFVFVTATLTIAFFVQGGHDYASGKYNLVVSKRKTLQIMGENIIRGRKMVSSQDFMKMEKTKEIGARAEFSRKSRIFRENYEARFVAFNADYRGPRHHPPKNN